MSTIEQVIENVHSLRLFSIKVMIRTSGNEKL